MQGRDINLFAILVIVCFRLDVLEQCSFWGRYYILNFTPEKKWDIGDVRPNGSKYDFANWAIGYCKDYNIDT